MADVADRLTKGMLFMVIQAMLTGIVYLEMTILSSFTHFHVASNLTFFLLWNIKVDIPKSVSAIFVNVLHCSPIYG